MNLFNLVFEAVVGPAACQKVVLSCTDMSQRLTGTLDVLEGNLSFVACLSCSFDPGVAIDLRARLEMAKISNDSTADQLQCAMLAVLTTVMLATMTEQSKCRMLLPRR